MSLHFEGDSEVNVHGSRRNGVYYMLGVQAAFCMLAN